MRRTLEEANATVDQLREIAATIAQSTLTDIIASHFIGGMSLSKTLDLKDEIVKSLEKLGVKPEQMDQVVADWNKGIRWHYARRLTKIALREIPENYKEEFGIKRRELGDFDEWLAPTPGQLRKLFESFDYEPSPEVSAVLEDYEHFRRTGEIRDRGRFVTI